MDRGAVVGGVNGNCNGLVVVMRKSLFFDLGGGKTGGCGGEDGEWRGDETRGRALTDGVVIDSGGSRVYRRLRIWNM